MIIIWFLTPVRFEVRENETRLVLVPGHIKLHTPGQLVSTVLHLKKVLKISIIFGF